MVAGAAVQKLMMTLSKEQEILMNIADMAILTFHAESALLRLMKLVAKNGTDAHVLEADMARCYLNDAMDAVNKFGKEAINSFAEGDEQRMMLMGLKRFTKYPPSTARRQGAGSPIK